VVPPKHTSPMTNILLPQNTNTTTHNEQNK